VYICGFYDFQVTCTIFQNGGGGGWKLKNFPEIFCPRRVLSHFPFSYNAASVIILECRTDGTFAVICILYEFCKISNSCKINTLKFCFFSDKKERNINLSPPFYKRKLLHSDGIKSLFKRRLSEIQNLSQRIQQLTLYA
jgi:hypothetical protein